MSTTLVERPVEAVEVADPVRDVLREAKERIVRGWWQHDGSGNKIRVGDPLDASCVWTAIDKSAGKNFDRAMEAARPIFDAIGVGRCSRYPASIFMWNDAPERTHADVVSLFDRALAARAAA